MAVDNENGIHDVFEIPGRGKVSAKYNELVSRRAVVIRDTLLALREIPEPEAIMGVSPEVVQLLMAGFGAGGSYHSDDDRVNAAIRFVRRDIQIQQTRLLNEALEVAILETNMYSKNGQVNFRGFDMPLLPEDFDDAQDNEDRAASLKPPLPIRHAFHPDEQKVALVRKLKREEKIFNRWFLQIFDRAATAFAAQLQQEVATAQDEVGATKS